MKITKNYLTSVEIIDIAENMKLQADFVRSEVCRVLMMVDFCTDVEVPKNEDGFIIFDLEFYDKLLEEGAIQTLEHGVVNFAHIAKQYDSLMDIKKSASHLIEKITEKIDGVDMNKLDVSKMIGSAMDIIKGVGNGISK